MHKHVVQFVHVRVVLHRAEATEPQLVNVTLQWTIRGDQHVHAEIELLSADEQRVLDVSRYHVRVLAREVVHPARFTVASPLLDLRETIDEKDAGTLRTAGRLHDPRGGRILTKLLHKEIIITGKQKRRRNEIQKYILPRFVFLRENTVLLLKVFTVTFQVLQHQIFPGEVIMVWEMIDYLIVVESVTTLDVEYLSHCRHRGPIEVPVAIG